MPHIDQDEFFNSRLGLPMPKTWSPVAQRSVTLYDDKAAIDWSSLAAKVTACRVRKIITITGVSGSGKSTLAKALIEFGVVPDDVLILTGFYLPPWILAQYGIQVTSYIVLIDITAEICIERRRVSKAALSSNFNAEADEWMVRNHVIPLYEKGFHAIKEAGNYVCVNATRPFDDVLATAKKLIVFLVL